MGNKASFFRFRCKDKKSEHHEQNRDRISDLPDDILHRILSFLPFKSIYQTSVLSTRWSYLCASCPVLDFSSDVYPIDDDERDQQAKLMKFISTALSRRNENFNIEIFRVSGPMRSSRLHEFIHGAVKHRVEELALQVHLIDSCTVPQCLYDCDSLKNLKLISSSEHGFLKTLGAKIGLLPSLHTLTLFSVDLLDSALDAADLFSSSWFPCLEQLIIVDCRNLSPRLKISCPNLKRVFLSGMVVESLDIYGVRLENLVVNSCSFLLQNVISWVKIFAPNVQNFLWQSNKTSANCVFSIKRFPILRTAQIDSGNFPVVTSMQEKMNNLVSLLFASSEVQNLVIGYCQDLEMVFLHPLSSSMEILSNIYFRGGLPYSFMKLEALMICTVLTKCEIPAIACLLKSSPVAHTLTISTQTRRYIPGNETWNNTLLDHCTEAQYWESQAENLSHFLCQLKVVEIYVTDEKYFPSAVTMGRFLLAHGGGLQEMILSSRRFDNGPLWKDKVGLLEQFPRASAHIKFSVVSELVNYVGETLFY